MKNILILMVLAIMAASCVTQSRCERKFPPEQSTIINDSIVITEQTRYYDSIIYTYVQIPKYTVRDSVVIVYKNGEASVVKPLKLQGKYSVAMVWIQNNILRGELTESGWIPIEAKLRLQEKTINELRNKETIKTIVEKEKYVPFFIKVLAWIGGICILVSVLILVIKFIKPKWL